MFAGAAIFAAAHGAIHEIEAFMLFLIAAVLLSGAAIVDAIHVVRKKLDAFLPQANATTATTIESPSATEQANGVESESRWKPPPRQIIGVIDDHDGSTVDSRLKNAQDAGSADVILYPDDSDDIEPPNVEPDDVPSDADSEQIARQLLASAKQHAADGNRRRCVAMLKEILQRFPETQAAKQARKTLERSGIQA